jgi:hypothetical protein
MTLDPTNAWVVTRNGEPVHVRMTKAIAEACATIDRDWISDPSVDIKVVPVLITEIEDVK